MAAISAALLVGAMPQQRHPRCAAVRRPLCRRPPQRLSARFCLCLCRCHRARCLCRCTACCLGARRLPYRRCCLCRCRGWWLWMVQPPGGVRRAPQRARDIQVHNRRRRRLRRHRNCNSFMILRTQLRTTAHSHFANFQSVTIVGGACRQKDMHIKKHQRGVTTASWLAQRCCKAGATS